MSAYPQIRVTHTYDDGWVRTWTQTGDTEANYKKRKRWAGTQFRHGPGWIEVDRRALVVHGETLSPHTERIDWL